ncbi:hypothetical protein [Hymenobacter ruber]
MPPVTNSSLAFTHWGRSTALGFVYLLPSAVVAVLAYLLWGRDGYPSAELPLSTRLVSAGFMLVPYALGTVFWGSIFLGIPAVLVGLLRIWPMSWLFKYCLNDPVGPDMTGFLLGTFIIFEAPVVALMLFVNGWPRGYSIGNGMICQLASLPWLCASLRTAYTMMRTQIALLNELQP